MLAQHWLGFSPSPRDSRKKLPFPSILTKAPECSYSAGPLIRSAQRVSFGTNYPFFPTRACSLSWELQREYVQGCQGSEGALVGRKTLLKET